MKNLKKVIALIIVAVMALSLNTFALNIAFDETLDSAPVFLVDSNDEYMCFSYPDEAYEGTAGCVVHVYKNIDGKWTNFSRVITTSAPFSGTVPFKVLSLRVTKNNKLMLNLMPQPHGVHCLADVNLGNLKQGEDYIDLDGVYSHTHFSDGYISYMEVIGDLCWVLNASNERLYAYNYVDSRDLHDFYYDHMLNGWSTTEDRNYTYKINDAGNCGIYDANAWRSLSGDYIDYTDLKWTVQVPEGGIAAMQVSGNYLTVVSEDNMVYGYNLAGEAVDGVLPYTEISSIYGSYGSMDMFDKYAAVYSQTGKRLYIFNIETGSAEDSLEVPAASENGAHVEFNETGVAVGHVNGGIDTYEIKTGIEMNVDMLNAQYNEDYTKMSVNVLVINGTLDDFADGKVILATYEGEELIDVSVKDLPVLAGRKGDVWTDYVDVTTTTKAFYWTSGYEPIIKTPFEDIWVEEDA